MRTFAAVSVFLLASAAGLLAQGAKLQFEVASVRPMAPIAATGTNAVTAGVRIDGAQFRATMMSLRDLLAMATKLRIYQIEAPDWMLSQRYEIAGTLPEGHTKMDEVPEMLQALLTERFHMKTHREQKDFPVYALTVAKGGIQAKEDPLDPVERSVEGVGTGSAAGSVIKLPRGATLSIGGNRIEAKKFQMLALADTLARFVDRPVVDQTGLGLEAAYDITLELTQEDFMALMVRSAVQAGVTLPPQAMRALEASGDSLHTALAKMGLKLEPKKAPLEVLVIDAADKTPSEN